VRSEFVYYRRQMGATCPFGIDDDDTHPHDFGLDFDDLVITSLATREVERWNELELPNSEYTTRQFRRFRRCCFEWRMVHVWSMPHAAYTWGLVLTMAFVRLSGKGSGLGSGPSWSQMP
jgi:hypothetical protein